MYREGGREGMHQNVRLRIHREGVSKTSTFYAYVINEWPLTKKYIKKNKLQNL